MISYEIPLETPAKKNSRITLKNGRTIPSKRYKTWHENAFLLLKGRVKEVIDEKCYIILIFTHGDFIRRDSDNGTSSIFDLLQDIGQLSDDNWKIIKNFHVFNNYEKGNPKCQIKIYKESEFNKYSFDLLAYTSQFC